jgi:hypothetical protein
MDATVRANTMTKLRGFPSPTPKWGIFCCPETQEGTGVVLVSSGADRCMKAAHSKSRSPESGQLRGFIDLGLESEPTAHPFPGCDP